MSLRLLAKRALLGSVIGVSALASANDGSSDKLQRLRASIASLDIDIPRQLDRTAPRLCEELLGAIRSNKEVAPLRPVAEADALADERLSLYRNKCPRLDISEWIAPPPPGRPYHATSDFKVFQLPRDLGKLRQTDLFIFYAESYLSLEEKERFKSRPDIYPWAGYAYADGNGGGGLYSVIDTKSCTAKLQLIVHGGFSHRHQQRTQHFNQLFIYRSTLFAYDFHNYSGKGKNYAGIVVWRFDADDKVRQACVFDSADSRALREDALKKNMAAKKNHAASR